ncbi:hypothetical protein NDN08_001714 [Rhodosorus marinus]|uniref:RING-type domain-containing protein n=1 Tax=Rhodosorus marinus TaxID=101924 RepID=A0AAV8URM4_9RHOD|nr:hypothetical protein NDN08_001714 [Rhodosorus marinus]
MEKCGVKLDCGHDCNGYAGETTHVSCLVEGCVSRSRFQSGKDDCAICLDALDEEPCIELSCGHIWHLDCLKSQLQLAQPNPRRRLLFTGCSCAQCGKFCEHEALNDVLRNVTALRAKVDAMILEQAKVDELDKSSTVTTVGGAYYGKLLDYGRHIYAFYLCSVCEEPYFGGTVACADAEERDLPASDRMCTKCNSRGAIICGEASHRGFYVWKCRIKQYIQGVNLRKFVVHPSDICVEVSAKYMARTDCPSVFELVACILDSEGRILNSFSSGVLAAPADYWDGVRHVFEPTDGAHFALVVARGKDHRFWRGNFGSKVTCLSVRVLFDESVTDPRDIIYPEAFENLSEDNDMLLREAVRRAVRAMDSRVMRPQPSRSTGRADVSPLRGNVTDISDCRFM